jgi:SAM-dependent methyltransferase
MKGFVPTPRATVDKMVELLFQSSAPKPQSTVLDPGCGTGEFIDGVMRWCKARKVGLPRIIGVESDPRHHAVLQVKYDRFRAVRIEHADFLADRGRTFDFVVGNPPYVPITELSENEKAQYRGRFTSARGRFDLYLLFFEQALRSLTPGGRLVFITPEKYLYVETAGPLRRLLAQGHIEEIRLVSEDTFGDLVTYPTITAVNNKPPGKTRVVRRDGSEVTLDVSPGGDPWLPLFEGAAQHFGAVTLADLCSRISCGVATGADSVFVRPTDGLDPAIRDFAYPTIAGRELSPNGAELSHRSVMLIPYDSDGRLLPFKRLGALGRYLMRDDIRRQLLARTCVKRKPWYAFHETPRLRDIRRPKIVCKDIGEKPCFWVDRTGQFVPRHSVYYIVPRARVAIEVIASYLQSPDAHRWLRQNCQRAAQGFLRLQSRALQGLPLPDKVVDAATGGRPVARARRRPVQMELPFA